VLNDGTSLGFFMPLFFAGQKACDKSFRSGVVAAHKKTAISKLPAMAELFFLSNTRRVSQRELKLPMKFV
jgi:hypothetical protein